MQFSQGSSFAKPWLAAINPSVFHRRTKKSEVLRIQIDTICDSIDTSIFKSSGRCNSLAMASTLLNGAIRIFQEQVNYLYVDVSNAMCRCISIENKKKRKRDSEQGTSYSNNKKRRSSFQDYDSVEVDLTRKFATQIPRGEVEEIIDLDLGNTAALDSITIVDHADLDISYIPDDDQYPPMSEAEVEDFFSDFSCIRVKEKPRQLSGGKIPDYQIRHTTDTFLSKSLNLDQNITDSFNKTCDESLDVNLDIQSMVIDEELTMYQRDENYPRGTNVSFNLFDVNWNDEEIVLSEITKRKRKNKPLKRLQIDDTIFISDEKMFAFKDSDILRKRWSGIPRIRKFESCYRFCNTMLLKHVSEKLKYNLHEDIRNILIPVVPKDKTKISNNRLEPEIANLIATLNKKPIEVIPNPVVMEEQLNTFPQAQDNIPLMMEQDVPAQELPEMDDEALDEIMRQIPLQIEVVPSLETEEDSKNELKNKWNIEQTLRNLFKLWYKSINPISMNILCENNFQNRKIAAYAFTSIINLLSMQYVQIETEENSLEIKHIDKGTKLLKFI